MRVLHCIYDDLQNPWVGGGGAIRNFEIYRRLAERVEVTVVTGNYPGARDEVLDGVRFVRLGAARPYPWSRLSYSRAATRLLRRAEYDVAVVDFSAYTPIWIPRHRPVGMSVSPLAGLTAGQRWGALLGGGVRALERAMLRRARWFTATSRWTEHHLREIVGPNAHIDVVSAGVPDELFRLVRTPSDYLLYWGRFDVFAKGIDVLLEAMARLVETRRDLQLVVAGRGKDASRIRTMIRELRLERNVHLRADGSTGQRAELFAGARLLVMPSRFEGFGMVAAEAMAAGIPLIASDTGGLPDVVDPPNGGVLVPPGDAAALATALGGLLSSPERLQELSRSARRSAERFSWGNVAEQHLYFLEQIAAERNRADSPMRDS